MFNTACCRLKKSKTRCSKINGNCGTFLWTWLILYKIASATKYIATALIWEQVFLSALSNQFSSFIKGTIFAHVFFECLLCLIFSKHNWGFEHRDEIVLVCNIIQRISRINEKNVSHFCRPPGHIGKPFKWTRDWK